LPLAPLMAIVLVPVAAELDALSVNVLVLLVDVGLKLAVTPLGKLLAVNATLPVKLPTGTTVIVELALAPCVTDTEDGLVDKLKPAVTGALIVTESVVWDVSELLVPVPVPVIVTVYVPTGAELLLVNVRLVDVALEAGLNDAVTPLGVPLAVNVTGPLNPPDDETVTEVLALLPCAIDRLAGLSDRLKRGVAVPGVNTTVVKEYGGAETLKLLPKPVTAAELMELLVLP